MDKLAKFIQQCRIQEKGYLDLLKKMLKKSIVGVDLSESVSVAQNASEANNADFSVQQQELERLKEQQTLLRKIVDQQKELQQLKERQSALMKIQENADCFIKEKSEKENLNNVQMSRHSEDGRTSNNSLILNEAGN